MKWGKEKFTDVEANTDEPPIIFKAQLFALSNVEPGRQKVMVKGSVLKVGYMIAEYIRFIFPLFRTADVYVRRALVIMQC